MLMWVIDVLISAPNLPSDAAHMISVTTWSRSSSYFLTCFFWYLEGEFLLLFEFMIRGIEEMHSHNSQDQYMSI
jgi:hypothetical protein